jgi:hypothetical protein
MALIMVVQVQMATAQKADKSFDGWTLLGTRTVDYTIDRDVVSVKESPEIFKTLKFIVKNGTINMHKGTVHFTDGDKMDIEFSDEVNKTNDGRIVELKGNNKVIEKVTFWYDTKNTSDSKSIVEVWGKK